MLDQILDLVKEHLSNNPELAAAIPEGQEDAVHNEIANHIANTLSGQNTEGGGFGSLLSGLSSLASGGSISSALQSGLVNYLATKFNLPPSFTDSISSAIPGLLEKFTSKG